MPALSADPADASSGSSSLADVNNRRREPWVLEAVATCITRCAPRLEKYVTPSLELLWEIQKTGDIFFPKRWMDATLGGHQSATAAPGWATSWSNSRRTIRNGSVGVIPSSSDDLIRVRRIRELG